MVSATLRAVFPVVMRDLVNGTNSLVVASASPVSPLALVGRGAALPADLDPVAETVASRMLPALSGGAVYTDDKAPVEWLTDLSILDYAVGKR